MLFEPEIAPNTGNIIRLSANTGSALHLIKPLGFSLEEKKLRRAGLDYHEYAGLFIYENWQEFRKMTGAERLFGVSTRGEQPYSSARFEENDYLVFGPETRGLPHDIRGEIGAQALLRIPMQENSRSLNLSNAAAILVYEAWRQLGFPGGS